MSLQSHKASVREPMWTVDLDFVQTLENAFNVIRNVWEAVLDRVQGTVLYANISVLMGLVLQNVLWVFMRYKIYVFLAI